MHSRKQQKSRYTNKINSEKQQNYTSWSRKYQKKTRTLAEKCQKKSPEEKRIEV